MACSYKWRLTGLENCVDACCQRRLWVSLLSVLPATAFAGCCRAHAHSLVSLAYSHSHSHSQSPPRRLPRLRRRCCPPQPRPRSARRRRRRRSSPRAVAQQTSQVGLHSRMRSRLSLSSGVQATTCAAHGIRGRFEQLSSRALSPAVRFFSGGHPCPCPHPAHTMLCCGVLCFLRHGC